MVSGFSIALKETLGHIIDEENERAARGLRDSIWKTVDLDARDVLLTAKPAISAEWFLPIDQRGVEYTWVDEVDDWPAPEPRLSPAGVAALTTFVALEFLRQRKAEVRQAECSGDYSGVLEEFRLWIRRLFEAWYEALRERTQ